MTIMSDAISSIISKAKGKSPRPRHPELSEEDMKNGCQLGIYSWADTSCAGKHAYIESYVKGKIINATGFLSSLESINNLPIVTAVYVYDFLMVTPLCLLLITLLILDHLWMIHFSIQFNVSITV